MFKRKNLLYMAAFFVLFVFVGHTSGVILPKPQGTEALVTTQQLMKQTLVQMPVGSPRSLTDLMLGVNIFLSIYLLVSGILFILLARKSDSDNQILILNSAGLALGAIVAAIYIFPVPAVCTGFGAILGFIAYRKK